MAGERLLSIDLVSPWMLRDQTLMNEAYERYRSSLQAIEERRKHLKTGDASWNLVRVILFLVMLVTFTLGYLVAKLSVLAILGWIVLFVFLVVVTLHQRLRDQLEDLRHQRSVMRRLIARLERRWDRLPIWKPEAAPNDKPVVDGDSKQPKDRATDPEAISDDLDVFGKGSLFQFVSVASTGPGLRTLAQWIIGPAVASDAKLRSEAANSLASQRSLRDQLYNLARRASAATSDPDHFLRWITAPSWLSRHQWMTVWACVCPLLSIVFAILFFVLADEANAKAAGIALGIVVCINALISTFLLGEVHEIFASALAGRGHVEGYRQMFELSGELPESSPMLARIRHELVKSDNNAAKAMVELKRIAAATAIKHVALLFPVYLLLQMFGLWELHVLRYLERWQNRYRPVAAGWFTALGEFEAIASIAALADEYPQWARPTWTDADPQAKVVAKQLGHPLINDSVRVSNDIVIGPTGTLLLVTGSNMSGKSTMLRSVGLNVLLAGAGAPVCAEALSLPSLELATSIRVRDNLGEGVSFYMAELHSLARVVKHAERLAHRPADETGKTRLLFLLDEILQGTNSRERQIAVAHVLRHLVKCEAIGAITTHDLELADDPQLKAMAHTVHFRETITVTAAGEDTMTFDYRMREGVSPTTNALRLLEVVGLGKPDSAD
jgi:hypothetical protein